MKNILFGLMVSAFTFSSIQAAEAVKTPASINTEENEGSRKGVAYKPRGEWVAQSPVSQVKSPRLWNYYENKANTSPQQVKFTEGTPWFYTIFSDSDSESE